ncbi:MAG: DNA lyase [Chloroflexi bacterium]|nr:DNA lyase [Chloroflexota bacterium]
MSDPKTSARRRKVLRPRSVNGIKPYSVDEVYDILADHYGIPDKARRMDPTSELIWTILSQHTSDINAEKAFTALADKYNSWQEVLDAPTDQLVSVIRSGGLAQQKAPRIQIALHSIYQRTGGFDIAFLSSWNLDLAKSWLREIPGVGPKTAGVVLSFSLNQPAMAVDTHIYRVSKRLALIGPKVTADQAHDLLEKWVKPDRVLNFHVFLISHGREICKALRPLCYICPLNGQCPSREKLITKNDTRSVTKTLNYKPL